MKRYRKGYTLIELLVVMVVLALVSIVATQTIVAILRASKKAEAINKVRQNLDYAVSAMERQIRSAKTITSTCSTTGTVSNMISFLDAGGTAVVFTCFNPNSSGQPSYIASTSGTVTSSLTSSDVTFSKCSFTCVGATSSSPPYVTIDVVGSDVTGQSAGVPITTQVTLRSY
jgi:prepilin-type N-terminal cleavage/methylation domain-containing protein